VCVYECTNDVTVLVCLPSHITLSDTGTRYWAKGDVALSIVMSFVSTIMAVGMLPLCILLYIEEGGYAEGEITIDYVTLVASVALVALPGTTCVCVCYVYSFSIPPLR
jgi:predicted Na+-dependent transporter